MLISIYGLLFNTYFLALYTAFNIFHHLNQGRHEPLGRDSLKFSRSGAILQCFHENFMVWVNEFDGYLNKERKVLPQIFGGALPNVEKAGGNHLSVYAYFKVVD